MKRIICPYLGLKDDPTTTLSFPSPGNYCHQARPIAPVRGTYQEKYCLTANHIACPLYQAAHPIPLPAAVTAKTKPVLTGRQTLALLGIPVLMVTLALFVYLLSSFGSKAGQLPSIPDTGRIGKDLNFGLLGGNLSITLTPFTPENENKTTPLAKTDCPLPAGWAIYIVKPTDSLFRLSVIYGVSVEELQRANCMGDETVILPDQVIYVPFIPTNTPVDSAAPPPNVLPTSTDAPNNPQPKATNTSTPPVQPKPTDTTVPTVPVATPTPQATNTSLPTVPPTNVPLPTATNTPQPTNSPRPTNTPRRRRTPIIPPQPSPTIIPILPPSPTSQPPAPTNPPPTATNAPPPTQQPTDPPPPTEPPPPPPTESQPTATNAPPPTQQPTDPPPPTEPPPAPTEIIPLPTIINPIISTLLP